MMEATLEAKIARDVEHELARLVIRSPRLVELPITPLFDVNDLVRLELALDRFAQVHRSGRSRRLVESVRTILSVARTRLRVASTVRQAVAVADRSLR
jgi:hypothetical protein